MKSFWTIMIALVMLGLYSQKSQAQDNRVILQQLYEVLQDRKLPSRDRLALFPAEYLKKAVAVESKSKYSIDMGSILKNKWRDLEFKDFSFQELSPNQILVTGRVKGRKPTECNLVSNDFKHFWTLNNGKIIGFKE